jgi:hypothetical protein
VLHEDWKAEGVGCLLTMSCQYPVSDTGHPSCPISHFSPIPSPLSPLSPFQVPSSRQELIGSGYCLMQLAWAGEAWTLAPATPRTPSSSSAAAGGNGAAGAGASSSGSSGPAGASAAAGGGEGSVLEKVEVEGSAMAELARR